MSSVEAITDAMGAATINDTPVNGDAAVPVPQVTDAAATSADEGRRLYIGNLAYATSEEELKEFFKAYTIESTSIPVNPRTNRPVGYAFVDLATSTEASTAIEELSGKEILSRKVSVQLARKPEFTEAKDGASGGEGASGTEGRKRAGGRGRGRGRARGRGGRASRGREGQEETDAAAAPQAPETETAKVSEDAAATTEGAKQAKPRVTRPQKQRGPPEDGIPSKTKVMVANLPYDLTEDKLKEIFAEYNPVSAKVALRPIPRFMIKKLQARNERRKTRGFGFVSMATEELQAKAVSEMNGKEIEGRTIAVKVAIDSPGKEDEDVKETEESKPSAEENTAPEVEATVEA